METTVKITNRGWLLTVGLLFGLLGVTMIIFSDTLIEILRYVLSGVLFVTAISAVWAYVRQQQKGGKNEWYLLLGAVLAIALGVCLIVFEDLLFILLTGAAAVWALVQSVRIIAAAIAAKSFNKADWSWFVLVGLLAVLFAVIFFAIGVETIVKASIILLGVAALLMGIYFCFVYVTAGNRRATLPAAE